MMSDDMNDEIEKRRTWTHPWAKPDHNPLPLSISIYIKPKKIPKTPQSLDHSFSGKALERGFWTGTRTIPLPLSSERIHSEYGFFWSRDQIPGGNWNKRRMPEGRQLIIRHFRWKVKVINGNYWFTKPTTLPDHR